MLTTEKYFGGYPLAIALLFIATLSSFSSSAQSSQYIFLDNGNVKTDLSLQVPQNSFILKTTLDPSLTSNAEVTESVLNYTLPKALPAGASVRVVPDEGWLAPPQNFLEATLSFDRKTISVRIIPEKAARGEGTAWVVEIVDAPAPDANILKVGGGLATMVIIDPSKQSVSQENGYSLSIAPNPAAAEFHFSHTGDFMLQGQLVSATGAVVRTVRIAPGQDTELPVRHLPNGIYYFQATNGPHRAPVTLAVQH